MRNVLAIVVTVFIGTTPLFAEQRVDPRASGRFGALRRQPAANPYAKLFEARGTVQQALEQQKAQQPPQSKTRVVCGMTVIEVGPALDPKMGVERPKDDNTRYTIRAVDPPICR